MLNKNENNDFNIRQGSSEDLEVIFRFTRGIHEQEDDQSIPTHINFSTNLKRWLSLELENPLSLFLIAEINNKAIGFIAATTVINDNGFLENPTKGLINLLWVEENYRRNNLAKMLVNTIENCFLENAVNIVECSFTKTNLNANEFWPASGYAVHSLTARKFLT